MAEAFVYCWTDHATKKLYVGSHKGMQNDGYVCSSKLMLEQYNQRPTDFTRQILAEGCLQDIRKLEAKILESIDARLNEVFYNQTNGNANFYHKNHTKKSKDKISKTLKGRKPNINQLAALRNNVKMMKLRGQTEKQIQASKNVGLLLKTYGHSEEAKQKISISSKGRIFSESCLQKRSENNGNKRAIRTPYGEFHSIRFAANKLNIHRRKIEYRLITNKPGWSYI